MRRHQYDHSHHREQGQQVDGQVDGGVQQTLQGRPQAGEGQAQGTQGAQLGTGEGVAGAPGQDETDADGGEVGPALQQVHPPPQAVDLGAHLRHPLLQGEDLLDSLRPLQQAQVLRLDRFQAAHLGLQVDELLGHLLGAHLLLDGRPQGPQALHRRPEVGGGHLQGQARRLTRGLPRHRRHALALAVGGGGRRDVGPGNPVHQVADPAHPFRQVGYLKSQGPGLDDHALAGGQRGQRLRRPSLRYCPCLAALLPLRRPSLGACRSACRRGPGEDSGQALVAGSRALRALAGGNVRGGGALGAPVSGEDREGGPSGQGREAPQPHCAPAGQRRPRRQQQNGRRQESDRPQHATSYQFSHRSTSGQQTPRGGEKFPARRWGAEPVPAPGQLRIRSRAGSCARPWFRSCRP